MHALESTLELNVVAVYHVSSAFLPPLQQGKEKQIVNMTTELGSIPYNENTKMMPILPYKISKTALNMLTVQYSNDLGPKGFAVFCVSLGRLRNDLGGADADLAPDVKAKATMNVIYNSLTKDNGAFRNIYVKGLQLYDGQNPPW